MYDLDIYPLHKYLKRIEINISNNECSWSSDRDYDEEYELYDKFVNKFPNLDDSKINQKILNFLINKISNNKLFHNKIIVSN